MNISFPYIGNYPLAFKNLIEKIGHTPLVPPKPSKRTLTLGVQHAPEYACLPFKILLGTYLEAIEKGADLIVASGGNGPCRAGYYGILHDKILKDLGYNVPIIVFDSVFEKPWEFFSKLSLILKNGKSNWLDFVKAFRRSWQKVKVIDQIELTSHRIRPLELEKGNVTRVVEKWLNQLDAATTNVEIQNVRKSAIAELLTIPCNKHFKPLRIGIVGEIYVVLEPYVNFNIIETLGNMGVYAHRSISLSGWARENTYFDNREKKLLKKAAPYLKFPIGGHGINSVGEAVEYAEKGFDGLIQLAPFSCIPEIVTKGILIKISHDLNIPTLTVFLDEQTAKAGLTTRLEAFIDLLYGKREKGALMKI